jgi:hypothetical protein
MKYPVLCEFLDFIRGVKRIDFHGRILLLRKLTQFEAGWNAEMAKKKNPETF